MMGRDLISPGRTFRSGVMACGWRKYRTDRSTETQRREKQRKVTTGGYKFTQMVAQQVSLQVKNIVCMFAPSCE